MLTDAERIRDTYAIMISVKELYEALLSDFGLRPGESKRVGNYVVTAPQPARFAPFIKPVEDAEAAA